jgi:mono/diheme cytochrome c family protein
MRELIFLALMAAAPAMAQEPGSALALGEETYQSSCAGCHGEGADGNGPMTEILTVPVPDLTGLSARNGGTFPWLRVVHTIDGRSGLRGHGGPMPIFGLLFQDDPAVADGPDGNPVFVSARVLAVVEYLESIQREGG